MMRMIKQAAFTFAAFSLLLLTAASASAVNDNWSFALKSCTQDFITISVDSAVNSPVVVFLAAYEGNGRMTDVSVSESLTGADADISIPYSAEIDHIKAFVLDAETFVPLRETWTESNLEPGENARTLVAYFSYSGGTKQIAEYIRDAAGAELYRIEAAVPYTDDILKYYDSSTRAYIEQNDSAARPQIANTVADMEKYDVIYLGYPIWYGQAPKIMYTFLESYNFSGKTIIPFCTSGSSGIASSVTNLRPLANNANWLSGRRFNANDSYETVSQWVAGS